MFSGRVAGTNIGYQAVQAARAHDRHSHRYRDICPIFRTIYSTAQCTHKYARCPTLTHTVAVKQATCSGHKQRTNKSRTRPSTTAQGKSVGDVSAELWGVLRESYSLMFRMFLLFRCFRSRSRRRSMCGVYRLRPSSSSCKSCVVWQSHQASPPSCWRVVCLNQRCSMVITIEIMLCSW